MERLNLSAENNRAFSVSDETQQLLSKFKLIFKDLVTGVPTAYRDLESLLTNGDKQLKDAFGHLPGFLQKLVQQLPERFTESLGPELMAVAGERASKTGVNMENAGKAAAAAQKMGFKAPNLKELVGKPTAIAGMMRSIITFLRARFPAVLGMNVLWSLALFSKFESPERHGSMLTERCISRVACPLVLPQARQGGTTRERAPCHGSRNHQNERRVRTAHSSYRDLKHDCA